MKLPRSVAAGLALLLLLCTCGDRPPTDTVTTPDAGPALVWADEFDGSTLDTTKWRHHRGTGYNDDGSGWGNNELQYYRPANTRVADGHLVITARRDTVGDRYFTSSRLTTDDLAEFTYGRMDIRAKLPIGQGIWPAIWMLGAEFPDGDTWPNCGEIDIMEFLGHQPNTLYGTAHFGTDWRDHRFIGDTLVLPGERPLTDRFNVYSVDWRRDTITWLFNDRPFHELTAADAGDAPWPFNAPQYFLLNLAVGGNWPGNPDSTTVFPQEMLVDYVRVYEN